MPWQVNSDSVTSVSQQCHEVGPVGGTTSEAMDEDRRLSIHRNRLGHPNRQRAIRQNDILARPRLRKFSK
jgi:hypothetical protein